MQEFMCSHATHLQRPGQAVCTARARLWTLLKHMYSASGDCSFGRCEDTSLDKVGEISEAASQCEGPVLLQLDSAGLN